MNNEHGGRDVIARSISASMRVPMLEELRAGMTEAEYLEILGLAQKIVESTAGSTLATWQIGIAIVAAAAMYQEALERGAAIMGRGPGVN